MENITLHVLPEAFLFDLGKDVIPGDGDWSDFLRQHRRKMAIMRGLGLKLDKPYPRPFNLPERGNVAEFVTELENLYLQPLSLSVTEQVKLTLSQRRLGLKETLRYLRGLYEQRQWETLQMEFGYILAQLAHLAYPTWVTPEISLSFLWRMGWPLMKELGANAGEVLPIEPKPRATPIDACYMAGIYLSHNNVLCVRRALEGEERSELVRRALLKQIPREEFEPGLKRIEEALAFAERQGHGVLEAGGVLG